MINNRALITITVLAVLAWILSASFYVVDETQRAIKLRFGEVVNADVVPGLHVKWPMINIIKKFDGRIQTLESGESRFLTAGRNALIVDSYVKWRIIDPSLFYQATQGDMLRAQNLIIPRIDESLRNAFGSRDVSTIISEDRDEMLKKPMQSLDKAMRQEVGVSILDIRLKRVELPQEVTQAVYKRMRTERNAEARQYRAQGLEQSERIRARADRERQVTLAQAREKSETERGVGEATAAEIYAQAFQQDPNFFRFYRSLTAYRKSFGNGDNLLLLSPDGAFWRYFNQTQDAKTIN